MLSPSEQEEFLRKELLADEAIRTLADIAEIPDDRKEAFCGEMALILYFYWEDANLRDKDVVAHQEQLVELEAGLYAAHRAFHKLPPKVATAFARAVWNEQVLFMRTSSHPAYFEPPLFDLFEGMPKMEDLPIRMAAIMSILIIAAARIANREPLRARGKGGSQNRAFMTFVQLLYHQADKHGGKLTANCKNNIGHGSMFQALDTLRAIFPEGFVKRTLPAQAIANIVNAERKRRVAR
jgi:hypothetical protein